MNLFILHKLPKKCAKYYFDSHVIKIILEAVQLLCTAKQLLDPDIDYTQCEKIYKVTHKNHPVSIWVRTSAENWQWTCSLVEALHDEWRYRYNHPDTKFHGSYNVFAWLRDNPPTQFINSDPALTTFAKAMPETYKSIVDPIAAYRAYYRGEEKAKLAKWRKREVPSWWTQA